MNSAETNQAQRASVGADGDSDQPIPPRYWWLKRIGLASLVILLLIGGLGLWWGNYASRALQAEIDRLQAAGEPILPEDFDPPFVLEEANAARLYLKAIEVFNAAGRIGLDPGLTPDAADYLETVGDVLDANTEVLALLRQARFLPEVDWGVRARSPVVGLLEMMNLVDQRALARLLSAVARYHHHIEDDSAAVELLLDTLALGDRINQQPTLVPHLVAVAVSALAAYDIEELSPSLQVGTSPRTAAVSPGQATREQVEALIRALLDEQALRQGLVRAFKAERMFQLDITLSAFAAPGATAPVHQRLLDNALSKPLMTLDCIHMLNDLQSIIDAAHEANWPALHEQFSAVFEQTSGLIQVSSGVGVVRYLMRITLPSLERGAVLHFRSVAARRLAATALAIRLYELDHGRRPETLDELVPVYIPEIPADPFAPDGRPLAYSPEAEHPMLYSVNLPGTDAPPQVVRFPAGGVNPDAGILPFYLDGPPPAPTPPDEEQNADEPEPPDVSDK